MDDIENMIQIVDDCRICSEFAEISASNNIITSFICRDKEECLRHTSYPLILPKEINDCSNETKDKCKLCARAKRTLNKKLSSIQKSKEIIKKYLKIKNLSPERIVKSCQQKIAYIQAQNLN